MNAAAGLKDRTDEGRLVQAHASTPGALSPWLAVLLVFFEGLAFSESPGYSSSPANFSAPVAQLDRVSGYEPEGRGFESCLAHQISALVRSNLIGVQYVKRAPVAQLDRVSGYEPEGRGFESCLAHHRTICLAAIRTMMRRSGREVECTPLLRVQVQYIGPRGFESLLLRHCSSAARQREAPVSFWMSGFCFA